MKGVNKYIKENPALLIGVGHALCFLIIFFMIQNRLSDFFAGICLVSSTIAFYIHFSKKDEEKSQEVKPTEETEQEEPELDIDEEDDGYL